MSLSTSFLSSIETFSWNCIFNNYASLKKLQRERKAKKTWKYVIHLSQISVSIFEHIEDIFLKKEFEFFLFLGFFLFFSWFSKFIFSFFLDFPLFFFFSFFSLIFFLDFFPWFFFLNFYLDIFSWLFPDFLAVFSLFFPVFCIDFFPDFFFLFDLI